MKLSNASSTDETINRIIGEAVVETPSLWYDLEVDHERQLHG
jgi:hypothetical protein